MNDNSEQSKPWDFYTSGSPNPSQTVIDKEAPWKDYGTSVNAISFGFVATALLISLFVIMAIFEHLLKPRASFSSTQDVDEGSLESGTTRAQMLILGKLRNQETVPTAHSDFSVLMPGQEYPTFIAQPAPLAACPREGVHWPCHDDGFTSPFINNI